MGAPEPRTVVLTSPVTCFGQTVESLTVDREGNGADLEAIDGLGQHRATLVMIQRLYRAPGDERHPHGRELTRDAVRALSMRDIARLDEAMAPFIGADEPMVRLVRAIREGEAE